MEYVTGPGRVRPGELSSEANEPARDWQAAGHQMAHPDGRDVPSARQEPTKHALLRGLAVQVKWLRIELPRERRDLSLVERVRCAGEALSHVEIVQVGESARVVLF